MIENLNLIGFNDEFINHLIEVLGYNVVLNLSSNYELLGMNINIMKKYNINNIYEILINRPDIFYKDSEEIILTLLKNKDKIEKVNEDYRIIDEIFE